jgi:pimeloyl-ACP methyl ester carboxylesterase
VSTPPEPPVALPPGRIVAVAGHGELFVRDSGGDGPALLLLHGWTVSADLNWFRAYDDLIAAGYRVIALDHRGHGRGTRGPEPFRLVDCAGDAAALLRALGVAQATVVGYSMGGPITQLLTRDHPDLVQGVVMCATSAHWTSPRQRLLWRSLALVRLALGLAPDAVWRRVFGAGDGPVVRWMTAELTRGSAVDLAEAGRELSRHDARGWVAGLRKPAASVVTTLDTGVPPKHQRALAALLRAPVFEVPGDHLAVTNAAPAFNAALLDAIAHVTAAEAPAAAA